MFKNVVYIYSSHPYMTVTHDVKYLLFEFSRMFEMLWHKTQTSSSVQVAFCSATTIILSSFKIVVENTAILQ